MTNELKGIFKMLVSAVISTFTIYGVIMAIYFA